MRQVKRNASIDVLKISMSFMVIGIHSGFSGDHHSLAEQLFVNGVFRIAVPVFFIINGFYFFHTLEEKKTIEWLKKNLLLYVFWMSFYSYFWLDFPSSWSAILRLFFSIIFGYHHLWYIPSMIISGTILYNLHKNSSKTLIIALTVLFLTGVAIQYAGYYKYLNEGILTKLFSLHILNRNALFFSFPFFTIGYLINKHSFYKNINISKTIVLGFFGLSFLLLESYASYYFGATNAGFDNYFSLILICPSIFLLAYNLRTNCNGKILSLYSSSIYFIHSFVLSLLMLNTGIKDVHLGILCALISIVASFFIIKIHRKIRFIL